LAVGSAVGDAVARLCSLAGREQASVIRERFALIGERWNFEYRDVERTRELGRHAQTIASLNDEAAALRYQIAQHAERAAELEQAVAEIADARYTRDLVIQEKEKELQALRAQLDALGPTVPPAVVEQQEEQNGWQPEVLVQSEPPKEEKKSTI
jgi:septal ring factor EnvC (AmiA/AmiB activator)